MKTLRTDAMQLGMILSVLAAIALAGCGPEVVSPLPSPAGEDRQIVFAVGASEQEDPLAAGAAAAKAALARCGDAPVKAVVVSESYEDKDRKAKLIEGVCSVADKQKVFGSSTYGSFTQSGCPEYESVAVLVIAGKDIEVAAACVEGMGTAGLTLEKDGEKLQRRLTDAGAWLAVKLPRTPSSRLALIFADAHSPKNGHLVGGMREVFGGRFPMTGGCANKNAGQTFVYYQGRMLTDSAVALMLAGDFRVALSGRQAKDNDKVIATARAAAAEAKSKLTAQGASPAAYLAFDCAGRMGKLDNVSDELAAMQEAIGKKAVLFGTYNAGEIGPADDADARPDTLSSGVGWHVMFTAIGW